MPIWRRIIIHHTASTDSDGTEIDSIREWHKSGRGWSDVGYHWIIERIDGEYRAVMARPMYRGGSHTVGHNQEAIGIAFVGDFMTVPPEPGMLDVTADLIAGLWQLAGAELPVSSHQDWAVTDCPGAEFPIGGLIARAQDRVPRHH